METETISGPSMSGLNAFFKQLQTRLNNYLFTKTGQPDSYSPSKDFVTIYQYYQYYISSALNAMPDPDEVLKKAGMSNMVYRELLTDAHVAGCLMQRKSRVLRMNLVINSGKEGDAMADKARDLCDEQISKIERMHEVVNEILEASFYGFTPLELYWNREPITTDAPQGEIVLFDIKAKPFEWFAFDRWGAMKIKNILSTNSFIMIDIPENKIIPAVNYGQYINPYGDRACKRVFWPYQFKKGGMRFWTEFIEKFGQPFLHGKMDSAASDEMLTQFNSMLVNMVRSGVITTRSRDLKTEIDVIESQSRGQSTDAYWKYKNAMNIEISKAILGETLTIENSESGSQNATSIHSDMLDTLQDQDRQMVERALDKIMRILTDVNFGKEVPSPKASLIDPKELSLKQAERDSMLKDKIGVQFTKEYIGRVYRLQDDDFEMVPIAAPAPGMGGGEIPGEKPPSMITKGREKSTEQGDQEINALDERKYSESENAPNQEEILKGVDEYVEKQLAGVDGLSKDMAEKLKHIILTSQNYTECTERMLKLSDQFSSTAFVGVLNHSLDIAEIVGQVTGRGEAVHA